MSKLLFTLDEACEALAISKPTLRRRMAEGRIAFIQTDDGEHPRIALSDLQEYISRHRVILEQPEQPVIRMKLPPGRPRKKGLPLRRKEG